MNPSICSLLERGLSWAIPHLADVLEGAGALAVVDGDAELNLRTEPWSVFSHADVGRSKAGAAESDSSCMYEIWFAEAFLNETHLPNTSEMEGEGVSLHDLLEHDQQRSALKDLVARSTHVLSCLDSMHARSLLNLATHHTRPCLSTVHARKHGLVEMLSPDTGCMRCRYGDAAFDREVVSCTEEGRRPVRHRHSDGLGGLDDGCSSGAQHFRPLSGGSSPVDMARRANHVDGCGQATLVQPRLSVAPSMRLVCCHG